MNFLRAALAIALVAPVPAAEATCYELYDAGNKLVYRSTAPLVDLSRSISDQVQQRFPGHHLVFSSISPCDDYNVIGGSAAPIPFEGSRRSASESPALSIAKPLRNYDDENDTLDALIEGNPPRSGTRRQPGTEVRVRQYYRKDGTLVQSHTRSAPHRQK